MFKQSQQEIEFIWSHWFQRYAPQGLLDTEYNGIKIAEWLLQRDFKAVSFDNLTEAVKALGDVQNGGILVYKNAPKVVEVVKEVPPVKTSAQEARERLEAAQRQGFRLGERPNTEFERWDEDHPQTPQADREALVARNAFDRSQKMLVDKAIDAYRARRGMYVSHALTGERKEELRAKRVLRADKTVDWAKVLTVVNECIKNYQDK